MNDDDLEQTYRALLPLLREKCGRILGDPDVASDVAQETLLRLWRRGPLEAEPRRRLAWCYRTATHLSLDHLKHLRVVDAALSAPVEAQARDLEETSHARRTLARLARRAPADELSAAVLHRVDGMTLAEVAEVTGASERTVRRRLARFDRRLDRLGRSS